MLVSHQKAIGPFDLAIFSPPIGENAPLNTAALDALSIARFHYAQDGAVNKNKAVHTPSVVAQVCLRGQNSSYSNRCSHFPGNCSFLPAGRFSMFAGSPR